MAGNKKIKETYTQIYESIGNIPKPMPSYWALSRSIVCLMTASLEQCWRPCRPLILFANSICSSSPSNRWRYLQKRIWAKMLVFIILNIHRRLCHNDMFAWGLSYLSIISQASCLVYSGLSGFSWLWNHKSFSPAENECFSRTLGNIVARLSQSYEQTFH